MELLKERFLRTYANIPLALRDDIILQLEQTLKTTGTVMKDSVTWRVAYIEIANESESGNVILEQLAALGLI